MGYATQDDRQFKAALEQIEGVTHKRTTKGRYYEGVKYRVDMHTPVIENPDILF